MFYGSLLYYELFRITFNKDVRMIIMTTTYNSDMGVCVRVRVLVCVVHVRTYVLLKNINFRLR